MEKDVLRLFLANILLHYALFTHHFNSAYCQTCKISNIQIDSEDGRQQYIELNLKKVDVDDEGSCPGCTLNDASKSGAYFQSNWMAKPPSFNLVFRPGEVILDCGNLMHFERDLFIEI